MVLLLNDPTQKKQPKRKKKKTDSESEKRLDFDDDFKTKAQLELEKIAKEHTGVVKVISQLDDASK